MTDRPTTRVRDHRRDGGRGPSGREGEPHGDDSLMARFERWDLTRFTAGDAIRSVLLAAFLLLILAGGAVRAAADELDPGLGRRHHQGGRRADRLGLRPASVRGDPPRPDRLARPRRGADRRGLRRRRRQRAANGNRRLRPRLQTPDELGTLLITGDSLSQPLDTEIAKVLADESSASR